MKKFFCFIASVLGLCVIFGSGWAAGAGKLSSAVNTSTEFTEPAPEEKYDECPDCGQTYETNGENESHIKFKFKIPSPSNLHNRIIKLPRFN